MLTLTQPDCIAPTGDVCGEGAIWLADENAVYWTDINRFLIHRLEVVTGAVRSWFFEEPVTALSLTTVKGRLLAALGSRLIHFWPETDRREDHGFHLPGWPQVRSNDGRTDPNGNLWLGSMKNNVLPNGEGGEVGKGLGELVRIAPDGAVTRFRDNLGIANTLCWTADRTRFYFADTLENEIRRYAYDAATSAISGEKVHFSGHPRGVPDGSAIDADGYLWNCRYGGGCILRIAPDGTLDRIIEMPVSNITTCCFGGPELSTLFITTARAGAHAGERLAGGLFRIDTSVKGLPENRFRIL